MSRNVWRYGDAASGDLYVIRDDVTGGFRCWRCDRGLAGDAEDEAAGLPVGTVVLEPFGHSIVVCPGCRVPGEPSR